MRFPFALPALLALTFAVLAASPAPAQPGWAQGEPIIDAQLVSEREQTAPGDSFHIGLHQVMPEGWHTYWRNPGDNGLPATLEWSVPEGVSVGEIAWPTPIELPLTAEIMDYGYKGEIVLPVPVTVSEDFSGDSLTFELNATWLVCEEICIPEEGRFSMTLPVGDETAQDEAGYWYIRGALDAVPQPDPAVNGGVDVENGRFALQVSGGDFAGDPASWRSVKFFPFEAGLIRHAAAQTVEPFEDGFLLLTEPGYRVEGELEPGQHGGVVTYERNMGNGWEAAAFEIHAEAGAVTAPIESAAPMAPPAEPLPLGNLLMLFVLAAGGGLLLNLMPCVFPVLSIKVLKFVRVAHNEAGAIRLQGIFFLIGVLTSFVLLAALLVGLREFGLPVGWGFQLQVPIVVAILAMLLFAIGLNLLGVFEVGTRLMGTGSGLADQPGKRGAFFTGVLAVVVAAPCVGPLAAGALGLALTQPAIVVLLVAAAMGLGLAAPFVVFAFAPSLLRILPKPGQWMVTFKQLLAFPMFASVVWLGWVLSIQAGATGVLLLGSAMVLFGFAVWAHGVKGVAWSVIAAIALAAAVASIVGVSRLQAPAAQASEGARYEAWSEARVAELQAGGQAVFVDVTAAWCVTCQVNKVTVLNDRDVKDAFERLDVAEMRADWTNRDEAITQLIYSHGQAGVPLYLLYPASGGEPQVLPTVLTRSGLVEALEAAAS